MPLCKAEAIIIRLTDYSETSQVAALYTREFGRMSVIAKGAKRPRNNFEGRLDLLCHTRIVFAQKKRTTLHILTECKLVDRFRGLRADVERLYAALYAAELVREMTPIEESAPPIFDLLIGTIRALSNGEGVDLTLLLFEAQLLGLAGYAPRLAACAGCDAEPLKGKSIAYSPVVGGVLCRDCRGLDPKSVGVPSGALAVLERLTNGSVRRTATVKLPRGMLTVLRKLMKATFAHTLGHEPKLMRYV